MPRTLEKQQSNPHQTPDSRLSFFIKKEESESESMRGGARMKKMIELPRTREIG